jgi:hypothetical protein
MARLNLDRLRAHPLSHEALQVGIDRPVLGGHGIEARLGAPGGVRRVIRGQRLLERLLNRVEDARFLRWQVAGEVVQECRLGQMSQSSSKTTPAVAGGVG